MINGERDLFEIVAWTRIVYFTEINVAEYAAINLENSDLGLEADGWVFTRCPLSKDRKIMEMFPINGLEKTLALPERLLSLCTPNNKIFCLRFRALNTLVLYLEIKTYPSIRHNIRIYRGNVH